MKSLLPAAAIIMLGSAALAAGPSAPTDAGTSNLRLAGCSLGAELRPHCLPPPAQVRASVGRHDTVPLALTDAQMDRVTAGGNGPSMVPP